MAIDRIDRKILGVLQRDSRLSSAELADQVGLSKNPCWRRVRQLQDHGFISREVALLNREHLGIPLTVFVSVRTRHHDIAWLQRLEQVVAAIPEVVEFYRMAGETDYLLKLVVPDVPTYDVIYKRLIAGVELERVTASFAMEEIKHTTELPLTYIPQ